MDQTTPDDKTLKDILSKLNDLLVSDLFDEKEMVLLLKQLKEFCNPQIGVIDFKYFDERRLKKARREKLKAEQFRNFQYVRSQRYLERVCQQYLELKTLFDLKISTFLYEGERNILLFCYFGVTTNDPIILHFLIQDERYVKLNIRV